MSSLKVISVKVRTGFVVSRKKNDTLFTRLPFPPVFAARVTKMVCQNDFIILLIYSLKRTNSVLQEHEEALKKKKEMVLNKTQLTRQGINLKAI